MDVEFEKYKVLLKSVNAELDKNFENQKDYIKCEIGCSHCCQKGYYPVSRPEAKLIREGFEKLPEKLREEITQKAQNLAKQREEFVKSGNEFIKFKYSCPFLTEDKCAIYEYRPFVCRMQGLIQKSLFDENSFNMPACVYIGLNYANIWDEEKEHFSEEKINALKLKEQPVALGFSYEYLMGALGFSPGDLLDNIENPENEDIRMIFEWALPENLNKY